MASSLSVTTQGQKIGASLTTLEVICAVPLIQADVKRIALGNLLDVGALLLLVVALVLQFLADLLQLGNLIVGVFVDLGQSVTELKTKTLTFPGAF